MAKPKKKRIPKCPECGEHPRGTADVVLATALIFFDDNDGTAHYVGESDVCWDSQQNISEIEDRIMLTCFSGHEWLAPKSFEVK